MSKPKRCSDEEFVRDFNLLGPAGLARKLNIAARAIYSRRNTLEKHGHQLVAPSKRAAGFGHHRLEWTIPDGEVLIGSDAHIWPGDEPVMMRAFRLFAKKRNPKAVILNGDIFDGANISRHAQIMWEKSPGVAKELEAVQDWLNKLVLGSPVNIPMAWPQGNHDARFETKLSANASEFANVKGMHLKDHFSNRLTPCWSVWINDTVVVKHRQKGGIHATHNNTVGAGKSMVTGHLHSAKVTPFTDYNGTRWGVDCGCLADPYGPQFLGYTEDGFRNHRAGFCVLTFVNGALLQPELCLVWDEDHVQFRGEIIRV